MTDVRTPSQQPEARPMRKGLLTAALSTAIVLLGPQAIALERPAFNPALAYDGTPESAARIRREVADQLREPPSAYFRDVRVIRPTESPDGPMVICGRIQGRNGYGGMGQHQGFFYTDAPTLVPSGALGDSVWSAFCKPTATVIETLEWNSPAP